MRRCIALGLVLPDVFFLLRIISVILTLGFNENGDMGTCRAQAIDPSTAVVISCVSGLILVFMLPLTLCMLLCGLIL